VNREDAAFSHGRHWTPGGGQPSAPVDTQAGLEFAIKDGDLLFLARPRCLLELPLSNRTGGGLLITADELTG